MQKIERIKIGSDIFSLNHIILASRESYGVLVEFLLLDPKELSINFTILEDEEAKAFWQYYLRRKETVYIATKSPPQELLVNRDCILAVTPSGSEDFSVWLACGNRSPLTYSGPNAKQLWESLAAEPHCLDITNYQPTRENLPPIKREASWD